MHSTRNAFFFAAHGVRRWVAMLMLVLLAACDVPIVPTRQNPVELTPDAQPAELSYNFGTEPLELDPLYASNRASLDLVTQLFDGLTYLDSETAQPQPALAEEWDVSADGRTYTFRLRSGTTWINQNGEPQGELTAEDLVYAIRRACRPDTDAAARVLLFIIEECERVAGVEGIPDLESVGVRAVERYIVEFQLNEPAAYFPSILALPVAFPVPADILERQGAAWSQWPNILTNGPYRLAEWTPGESLQLVKNDSHFRAAETRVVRVFGERMAPAEVLQAFREARIDTLRVTPDVVPLLAQDPELQARVHNVPDQCLVAYGITLIKAPMDSWRVRGALSSALDRNALAALLGNRAQPARHLAPPIVFGVPEEREDAVADDVARAQVLLAEAGFPEGAGLPPLTLAFPDGDEDRTIANAAAQMWREQLGAEIVLHPVPPEQYAASIARTVPPSEMPHLWLLRWCGAVPDEHAWISAIFSLPDEFASDRFPPDPRDTIPARTNPLRRVYGDIDQLLEEATQVEDGETRRELYAQAERLALQEAFYLIPLYHMTSSWLSQPWVTAMPQNMAGPLLEAWAVEMAARPGSAAGAATSAGE